MLVGSELSGEKLWSHCGVQESSDTSLEMNHALRKEMACIYV